MPLPNAGLPSDARLLELYGAPGGYRSLQSIARQFGVPRDRVRRRLALLTPLRSRGEQQRMDYALGRRVVPPAFTTTPPRRPHPLSPPYAGKRIPARVRRKISASQRRPEAIRLCAWCGSSIRIPGRKIGRRTRPAWNACSRPHSCLYLRHLKSHPEAARPLITERLGELCRDRALTYQNVAKQAQKIGAGAAEIAAVLAGGDG